MCSYATMRAAVDGSAKGPNGSWFHVTDATVYFDDPVHALAEHTLNIDLAAPERGPSARVAIELTAQSAWPGRVSPSMSRSLSVRRLNPRTIDLCSDRVAD